MCARDGAEVSVLCATRGESGRHREDATIIGSELGRQRSFELMESCRLLGAAPIILDLPDGDLDRLDFDATSRHLCTVLRTLAPHVVITLGVDGVYGSIDHRAWTRIVGRAHALLEGAERPRLLHCAFPIFLFEPVRRALRRHASSKALIHAECGQLGCAVGNTDLRVDIRSVAGIKRAAIAAHRSQLVGGEPETFLRLGLIRHLMEEEWFVVAGGRALPPGATQPFAGL